MADKTPEELKAETDAQAAQKQAEQDRRDIAAAPPASPVLPISMTPAGKDPLPVAKPFISTGTSKPLIADEPKSASDRIRAFEDEHLGKDAVRINGRVERGSGSPYQALSPELRRQHAALEKLVESEQKISDARAALVQAETDHETALAAAEPRPDAPANE